MAGYEPPPFRDGSSGRSGSTDLHTDLYALLHVSRDASDDELKRAYRQLASVYHPDKYPFPQMQDVAKDHFQRIRSAYEVLSDPAKRQVYDLYGIEGVVSGMELGPHLRTRQEIREEWERAQRRREELKAAMRTQHSSSMLLSVTAADALASGFQRFPRITGMHMSTQVQAALSDKDTLVLGGSMLMRRVAGGGSMVAVFRRQMDAYQTAELVAVVGIRTQLTLSTARQVSPSVKATAGVTWHADDGSLSLANSWTSQITESTAASINIGLGADGGAGVGWHTQKDKNNFNAELKVGAGLSSGGLTATFVRRFSEHSSGRIHGRLGTTGADVEVGGSRKISDNSSLGFFVTMGLQGTLWKVRYSRGGQKVTVPILLSPTLRPAISVPAILIPSVTYAVLKHWVFSRWKQIREARQDREVRQKSAKQVWESMAEARQLQDMMTPVVTRRVTALQQRQNGNALMIISAKYGRLGGAGGEGERESRNESTNSGNGSGSGGSGSGSGGGSGGREGEGRRAASGIGSMFERIGGLLRRGLGGIGGGGGGGEEGVGGSENEGWDEDEWEEGEGGGERVVLPPAVWDVRIPLQFLVDDASNTLQLHEGVSKKGIMGFCDPAPGLPKKLRVGYSYRGEEREVTVNDLDALSLPLPSRSPS
ncbi:hypothetical protein CLOM_g13385 [Closterium sp. NIES-68]|nr:hypothetical protein CLOM_g11266 [Closterium sp. NIES-68]GJP54277.1 hypothetical protein CLOM_g13385 [Closterium sp. NIES-68]